MSLKDSNSEAISDREIVNTRIFNISREQIFKVFSEGAKGF